MAGLLEATIRLWADGHFDWSHDNCGQSVLAYAAAACGREAPALPPINGERGARRLLRRAGGLEAFAGGIMARLACEATETPQRGDVGIIDVPGSGATCAICLGRLWMVKGTGGVTMFEPDRILKAWQCRKP